MLLYRLDPMSLFLETAPFVPRGERSVPGFDLGLAHPVGAHDGGAPCQPRALHWAEAARTFGPEKRRLPRTDGALLLLPLQHLPDIRRRVRRLAVGVAVVDLDLAEPGGGGEGLLGEGGVVAADGDHGAVHLVADPVRAAVKA